MEKDFTIKTENVETKEDVDAQETKTVTVEEMQRRIAKEKERQDELNQALEGYKSGESERIQAAIQSALEEAEKTRKMNADQLAEYKQKEAERKHQQELEKLNAQIVEFQQKERMAEIKDIAIQKLNEFNIKTDEKVINLVLADEPETTSNRIEALNELLTVERNKYIGQDAPLTGGGIGSKKPSSFTDILDNARIIK